MIDGSGSIPVLADVAILGEVIAGVGQLEGASANEVIDISGKVICPGFIDSHTHDDHAVIKSPQCESKITQGVTTVIVGNCGLSLAPVRLDREPPDPLNLLGDQKDFSFPDFGSYVERIDEVRPAVNVAALVGHTSLRVNHMASLDRTATEAETAGMRAELRSCLEQGAIGLSSGLAYGTAIEASTEEVIELALEVKESGGIYATHLRNEFDQVIEAMEESVEIGHAADIPVVISHLKCAGPDNWGRSQDLLDFIDHSPYRDRLHMDCYPYAAGSSTLDLKQVDERVKILITWSDQHPELCPVYLHELAAQWGISQLEAAKRLQPAGAVYFSISEEDMLKIISHPKTMIGSDGLPNDPHPHPRLWGTFPRVLAEISREKKLISLTEAVRKMTGLPAANFRLSQRGLVQCGYFADLVIFDEQDVTDTSTFENPVAAADGIEMVFVNGALACADKALTGVRRGRYVGKQP